MLLVIDHGVNHSSVNRENRSQILLNRVQLYCCFQSFVTNSNFGAAPREQVFCFSHTLRTIFVTYVYKRLKIQEVDVAFHGQRKACAYFLATNIGLRVISGDLPV